MGLVMLLHGKANQADPMIDMLLSDKDDILRVSHLKPTQTLD